MSLLDTLKLNLAGSFVKRIFSLENLKQPSSVRAYVAFVVGAFGIQLSQQATDQVTATFITIVAAAEAIKGVVNFLRNENKPLPWLIENQQKE